MFAGPNQSPRETRLRLLSWNLWFRFGPVDARQPAIEATVRELDPDVIALQETWEEEPGTGQCHGLAQRLGYHAVFAEGFRLGDHSFGNALLSRWPVLSHEIRELPAIGERNELRNVVHARIDGPRGVLDVYATHLNWRYEESNIRQLQVRAICEMIAESTDRPFPPILMGDFNAEPDSEEIRMLTGRAAVPVQDLVFHDVWEVAGSGPGHTWDNENPYAQQELEPNRRIDYTFVAWPYAANGGGHAVEARIEGKLVVDGSVGSDHWALYSELRY